MSKHPPQRRLTNTVHPTAWVAKDAHVDTGVTLARYTSVGPGTSLHGELRVQERAEIGAGADIAGFSIGREARVDDRVKLAAESTVGERAWIGEGTVLESRTHVGRYAIIGPHCEIARGTHVGHCSRFAEGVQIRPETRLEPNVDIGARTTLGEQVKVSPDATIGADTNLGDRVRVGSDAGVGITPPVRIGRHCIIAEDVRVDGGVTMGDSCRVDANAWIKFNAAIGPDAAIGAGCHIEPEAVVHPGETVPPFTRVCTSGEWEKIPLSFDDYDHRGDSDPHERVKNEPPAAPEHEPALSQIWIVTDINGEPYPKHGYFESRHECREHISTNIDSDEVREYDRDSMFEPTGISRAPNDENTGNKEVWIVTSERFLAPDHGFFHSRDRAAEGREPLENISKVQPARHPERDQSPTRTPQPDNDDSERNRGREATREAMAKHANTPLSMTGGAAEATRPALQNTPDGEDRRIDRDAPSR